MALFSKLHTVTSAIFIKKLACIVAACFFLAMLCFCIFYYTSSYQALKNWFFSFNPCFYQNETWTVKFFSPAVKAKGNQLSLAGCIIAVIGLLYIVSRWSWPKRDPPAYKTLSLNKSALAGYLSVFVLAILLGINSFHQLAPYSDEIFSAANCAMAPTLQCIGYYMLPNNHIYFNFLNHILFSWWAGDLVYSGRFISIAAYAGALLCAYHWLRYLVSKPLVAFILLLPVALQFLTWGFAAQARGYECQLLCGWVSFTSVLHCARHQSKNALVINTCSNIFGMALIPTFIYLIPAEIVFISCAMLYHRALNWNYLKYQVMFFACTFLLYLPAFCFSGMAAFTENRYVTPAHESMQSYIPNFIAYVKSFANSCFSLPDPKYTSLSIALFCVPLMLFFSKQKERRLIALFYTLCWLSFALFAFQMKRLPFFRNLIVQNSITMACVVYTLWLTIATLVSRMKWQRLKLLCLSFCAVPLLLFCYFLFKTNVQTVTFNLYGTNNNDKFELYTQALLTLPPGSSIAFAHDNFYLYYITTKMNFKISRCTTGNEDFYLKDHDELLTTEMANNYVFIKKFPEDFELYKKK